MLDIQLIREQPDRVRRAIVAKRAAGDLDRLLVLDVKRRELQQQLDELSRQRNNAARTGADRGQATVEGKQLKEEHKRLSAALEDVEHEYAPLLESVPNLPTDDTPDGPDARANKVLRRWGTPPAFDFPPKEHWELGRSLGLIDMERAAEVAGSRFAYLKGDLAILQFALIQHALALVTNKERLAGIAAAAGLEIVPTPFIPVIPPVFIKPDVLRKMARLEPRNDRYFLPEDSLYLSGSAEHTLGPLHMDQTLDSASLPRRYVGYSTAFRREAGSYGKDVHGILRVHQFDKLEMESFTTQGAGQPEQEFFVVIQEHLMQSLELPYQVVLLCTGEMGSPNARQIDLETWFPGQQRYRETHSADYVTDYQARRLRTKFRSADGTIDFVHMNDATVFAIGRTIAAILEVYQHADGSVRVPAVLRPYLSGRETLQALPGFPLVPPSGDLVGGLADTRAPA